MTTQQQNQETATTLGSEELEAYLLGYTKPNESHHYCACSPQSKLLIKWWTIGQADSIV